MTRARRIHQGERTHSERQGLEVPEGRVAELTVHDDGTSEARQLPEGTELRDCKACAKVGWKLPSLHTVVAPSGTSHVTSNGTVTLCGREITDGWTT